MTERVDVLVVGAGPAGLAAADHAARSGASVVLLDAADAVGGQFWRHLPSVRSGAREAALHHRFSQFQRLRSAVGTTCEVVRNAHVWSVEPREAKPPLVHVVLGPPDGVSRTPRTFDPRTLVLATGAHERTLPFPGWELPGVFTAGAAQALAKGERVAVGSRVLVAGSGPFLLPVAASLLRTGAVVVGILEAARPAQLAGGWGNRPWGLLPALGKGTELLGYAADLLRHRVPHRTGVAVTAAHGAERVEAVTVQRLDASWRPVPGTAERLEVDAVCVGHGFVPRTELAIAAGCARRADGAVSVDAGQRTSVPGVFAVGEVTGIGGVDLALAEGAIAGRVAAGAPAGRLDLRRRRVYSGFAGRMAAAHRIHDGWQDWLDAETLVCRCEDVTVGDLRRAAELTGSRGVRSLKLTTRAGLGSCQGRTCGRTVEELLGVAVGPEGLLDAGRTAHRPVALPVRLGELAATTEGEPL